MDFSELRSALAAVGQDHVLRFSAELSAEQLDTFGQQLRQLDLATLDVLTCQTAAAADWDELARRAAPPTAVRIGGQSAPFSKAEAVRKGCEQLRAGHVGVLLVAGGQGTRLGFPHPKGTYPIGPVSEHSIFQILIERVRATANHYGAPVPLFVMTSPATHAETIAFLDAHDRFGMPQEDVTIFCQGTMPAIDARTGKLLLASTDSLALSPDGHGGLLKALSTSGALTAAQQRGIRYLSYGQIDNPLVQIGAPDLVGYHVLAESEMTSQVIQKTDPLDRVGNVVMIDGRMHVIEYSDLPDDVALQQNEDGTLRFWAGSIAVHVFDVAFLQRVADQADALPFHRAHKKVPYLDPSGTRQVPEQPNAIKFERFIFDLMPLAHHPIVVEGRPADVFAPLKNAEGSATDTPTAVQQAMMDLHRRWLRQAGVSIEDDVQIEISPLWALDAQQVSARVADDLAAIESPCFLTDEPN